jgi:outer membrane protein assembly factor BamB
VLTVSALVVAVVTAVALGVSPGLGPTASLQAADVVLPASSGSSTSTGATGGRARSGGASDEDASTPGEDDNGRIAASRHASHAQRVRCVPAGCELWRRTFDPRQRATIAAGDGLVAVIEPEVLTAIDATTGQELWRGDLDDLAPSTSGGTRLADLAGRAASQAVVADDLVVVATPKRLAGLDRVTGQRRWSAGSTGWELDELVVVDDVAVVRGIPRTVRDAGGGLRRAAALTAFDLRDGTTRWQTTVTDTIRLDGPTLVVAVDDQLIGIAATDGRERWRRSHPRGTALTPAGPWLLTSGGRGHVLADPSTGSTLAELDGYLSHAVVEVDGLVVSVLLHPDASTSPGRRGTARGPGVTRIADTDAGEAEPSAAAELVAFRPDGSVVWRTPYGLRAPTRCCAALVPWDGGIAVIGLRGEREVRDLTTGALRDDAPRLALDGPAQVAKDGTLVGEPITDLAGEPALTTIRPDGALTYVVGPGLAVVSIDPLVVRGADEIVGVRVATGQ